MHCSVCHVTRDQTIITAYRHKNSVEFFAIGPVQPLPPQVTSALSKEVILMQIFGVSENNNGLSSLQVTINDMVTQPLV
jgi:hypothetical protein